MKAQWANGFLVALFFFLPLNLQAQGSQFPAKDFSQVRRFLCDPAQAKIYRQLGQTCQFINFTIKGEDLKGDGQRIWLFYGPSVECGAHGNCPLILIEKKATQWALLFLEPCGTEDCLNFGNATFSEVLPTSHQGLRDLLISSDSGSFFWVKDVYEWNGRQYLRKKDATTYFFYDSDKEQLVQVSQKRYESCTKQGKECLAP